MSHYSPKQLPSAPDLVLVESLLGCTLRHSYMAEVYRERHTELLIESSEQHTEVLIFNLGQGNRTDRSYLETPCRDPLSSPDRTPN